MNPRRMLRFGLLIGATLIITISVPTMLAIEEISSSGVNVDPWKLIVIPPEDDSPQDREIIRWQTKVQSLADPTEAIENLGWAFVAKARSSFDPGFYKIAEQCALCLDQKKPGCPEALLLRAHVWNNLHRFKEAELTARELVAKRGLDFDYAVLGDALMEQGKLTEAAAAYQKMMDQKPGPPAYTRAAHLRWLKGDLTGAIELMGWAAGTSTSRDPESEAWTNVRLAHYEWLSQDLLSATNRLSRALALQPDYPPALLEQGRVLLGLGKTAEAIAVLQKAAARNPLPEYQWVLIEALRAGNRLTEAETVETKLCRHGATDDPRTFALYLATWRENTSLALDLAKAELATRSDIFTYDALGWAYLVNGENTQAWDCAQRAIAEGTQDGRLFLHAGIIASAVGQSERAAFYLEKAKVLQQTLLPSERKLLTSLPVTSHSSSVTGRRNEVNR
ncbi:MAG: tetratricopeptide repeat protein [Verrucomicrobia bacterium]|nr:tetratricopeptide repeat protein [Verrucomicrobiota bacterium]